jgi:hypothetical protein
MKDKEIVFSNRVILHVSLTFFLFSFKDRSLMESTGAWL